MSIDVSVWVWKNADASGSALLVLLALADISNHEGVCWPSIPTIAARTRLHPQTVRGHLNDLAARGAIAVESVPGRSNRYTVSMDTPTNIATPSDSRRGTKTAQSTPTKPPEGTPTNPPETNGKEQSLEPSSSAGAVPEHDLPKGTTTAVGLPKPFIVTGEMHVWAAQVVPSVDVMAVTQGFVEYWREGEGRGKRKRNWVLTWRNWLKREHQRNVDRGWVPSSAPAAESPVSLPAWLSVLRVPVEEYLDRRGDAEWVASMEQRAARAS